jgi:tellurite resistance protein TerC
LLVTPGPALVVIPIGLGILSIEFSWARRWLKKVKDAANGALSARSSSCDDAVR